MRKKQPKNGPKPFLFAKNSERWNQWAKKTRLLKKTLSKRIFASFEFLSFLNEIFVSQVRPRVVSKIAIFFRTSIVGSSGISSLVLWFHPLCLHRCSRFQVFVYVWMAACFSRIPTPLSAHYSVPLSSPHTHPTQRRAAAVPSLAAKTQSERFSPSIVWLHVKFFQ